MSRAKSCVKNHSQMAKRFFFGGGGGGQWNVYARLHWPWLDWERGGFKTGLLSLWRCIYSMIYLLSERERERETMFFIVSASDLELISHGPLLVFHTPESSHDPGLAAQTRPGPQGPAILFHMGCTHLIMAGEKSIHTYTNAQNMIQKAHTHTHWCTFTKVLSFSRFFLFETHIQNRTRSSYAHTYITFPEILREVKTGSWEGVVGGRGGKKCCLLYSGHS